MNEDVELYLEDAKDSMDKTMKHLEKELLKIRAGKASPQMLDGLTVDYYGSMTPLTQVSNVGTSDARTIMVQPWEKAMIAPIEKAIMKANLGFNPVNNGEIIRINVPVLTEERRKQLAKQVKNEGENTKISIRNIRRDVNDEIKQLKKDGLSEDEAKSGEDEVQVVTNSFIVKVDKLIKAKETEIMTV